MTQVLAPPPSARSPLVVRNAAKRDSRGIAIPAWGCLAAGCLLLQLLACGDTTDPNPGKAIIPSVDRSLVTGEALAALDAGGRYTALPTPYPVPFLAVDADSARAIAVRFWAGWGMNWRFRIQDDAGVSVDHTRLNVCGRPLYAESAVDPAPATASPAFRAFYGPRWLVTLCDGASVRAILSISVFATGLLGVGAYDASSDDLTSGIEYGGVPPGARFPQSAEEATIATAHFTGATVTRVPRLVMADPNVEHIFALWAVEVSRSFRVRGALSGTSRDRTRFLFGHQPWNAWRVGVSDYEGRVTADSVFWQFDVGVPGNPRTGLRRRPELPQFSVPTEPVTLELRRVP